MDKPKATPKDFFLWAGAMIALYAGVVAFIALIFDYINYAMPDLALTQYYSYDPFQGSVSYEMATLIVLAPLFLILMRVIRRSITRDPSRAEIWVRRWALVLTLFVAGATIAVDLITLITTFLSGGDLTVRFLLKVLVVLLVAGAGFLHFMADIWGYWVKNPNYARYINWAVGVLVVLVIASGFLILGTPGQARQARLDQQRVNDLQNIQWQVVNYYQQKQKLPPSINALNDAISGYSVPTDPIGLPYVYKPGEGLSFELCAGFDAPSRGSAMQTAPQPTSPYGAKGVVDNWQHEAGQTCFERTIDPQRYPPINPKAL